MFTLFLKFPFFVPYLLEVTSDNAQADANDDRMEDDTQLKEVSCQGLASLPPDHLSKYRPMDVIMTMDHVARSHRGFSYL